MAETPEQEVEGVEETTKTTKSTKEKIELQSFSFPEHGITIQAKDLEEAQKILFSNLKK